MTVKAITVEQVPKATRQRVSPIKKTRDWLETVDAIRKDKFEALRVEFSDETLALGKATPDRFRRMLAMEVATMGRKELKVLFRGKSANGVPILYVLRGVVLKDYTKPFPRPTHRHHGGTEEHAGPTKISQTGKIEPSSLYREPEILHEVGAGKTGKSKDARQPK